MIELKAELFKQPVEGHGMRLIALRDKLQSAIELEHSTIPPYMYALYSLKPGANLEIAQVLGAIVRQEMLHMALACNLLNAIGGQPRIDSPGFVPRYPGPLPGAVESGLVVPLAPFSKQLVHDVFMAIEEPEHVHDYPVRLRAFAEAPEKRTIGQFYDAIRREILDLSQQADIFNGDRARQLTTGFATLRDMAVTDAASASAAIDLIVEQGEGTAISPLDPEHELSHFYKFQELYYGRKLIRNPDRGPAAPAWAFYGHAIAFAPDGVWPAIANPTRASYAAGSRLSLLNDAFNATYTRMLQALHQVFNGRQDQLAPAVLAMQALRAQAQAMMQCELVPGLGGGPTFDYTPAVAAAAVPLEESRA